MYIFLAVSSTSLISLKSFSPSCCLHKVLLSCWAADVNTNILRAEGIIPMPVNISLHFTNKISPNGFHYTNSAGDEAIITHNEKTDTVFATLKMVDGRSFCLEKCSNSYAWMEFDPEEFKADRVASLETQELLEFSNLDQVKSYENHTSYSVMFYYTPQFADITPDISGFVDQLLAETNQGYLNSDVKLKVRKHCIEAADIKEVESSLEMLKNFRRMKKSVAELRHSADAAVLLVKNLKNSCGIAYLNQIKTGSTLSIVQKSCAVGYYSFGHELGHNMGLHHNPEVVDNEYYPFGHGYLIPSSPRNPGYRTILAYSTPGYRIRVNYYSNPEVTYNITGSSTGKAGVSDNARLLKQNMIQMAMIGNESLRCNRKGKFS